jgi:hypothetical protein
MVTGREIGTTSLQLLDLRRDHELWCCQSGVQLCWLSGSVAALVQIASRSTSSSGRATKCQLFSHTVCVLRSGTDRGKYNSERKRPFILNFNPKFHYEKEDFNHIKISACMDY